MTKAQKAASTETAEAGDHLIVRLDGKHLLISPGDEVPDGAITVGAHLSLEDAKADLKSKK